MTDLSFWDQKIDIGNGDRSELQVTALENGTFVAVWTQFGDHDADIYAQIYDAGGNPLSDVRKVNLGDAPSVMQRHPSVTAVKGGGFAVTWVDYTNGANNADVKARLFDSAGNGGADILVGSGVEADGATPQIASWGTGFVISVNGDQGSHTTELSFFNDQGFIVGSQQAEVGSFESHAISGPLDVPADSPYAGAIVTAALFQDSGNIVVNVQTNLEIKKEITILTNDPTASDISVTALTGGKFLVMWEEADGTTPSRNVWGAIFSADGTSLAKTILASSNESLHPVATALPGGGFALAYETVSASTGHDIVAQIYNASGIPTNNLITVNADLTGDQTEPSIAWLNDGRILVSWANSDENSSSSTASAQILDIRDAAENWNGSDTAAESHAGTAFNDTLDSAAGNDSLYGGNGDDILIGGIGADRLDGGGGYDWVSYENASGNVLVDLSTGKGGAAWGGTDGDAVGDTYIRIEHAKGGAGHDVLIGTVRDNWLLGLDGDDILQGNGGSDRLDGGAGFDWASYRGAGGAVQVDLSTGATGGAAAGDVLVSIEALEGSKFDDKFVGNAGNNEIKAFEGNDTVIGGAGHDNLDGGEGNDTLVGGEGDDTLTGGAGNDRLEGGSGNNTAVFSGAKSQYTIGARAADGTYTVTGPNGTVDVLKDIHFLRFESMVGGKPVVESELLNAAPTNLTLSKASMVENAPIGTEVGRLSATDADGDEITYSLAPGSSGAFAIRGNSLVVAGPLDFETQRNHQVTIQAKDAYGGVTSLTVTLTVTNAIETTPFTIRGTPQADVLSGEAGNDTIYGGLSNDQLTGGSGKDVFVFDTRLNKTRNVDKISDFKSADDSFYLDNAIFTKLGKGTPTKPVKFKAGMFYEGKKAHDKDDRIVYDKKTGNLYYDDDGSGGHAQVKIATLANKTKLYYHDFYVI